MLDRMVAGLRSARTDCICSWRALWGMEVMACFMGNGSNVAGREGPVSGANSCVFGAFATKSYNYVPFRFALSVCLCV